ncbi:anaphase-promoting complex subunit 1 isoform X1 [Fundulus heteroclitus]|uniref:anaphase-promoting complex subunit 1 isoform X1 n=1 Tax=Fundulus heteroclitus TaxID=8078 RepID=UPI00165C316D|nr:anaphase-promoting complex subunit 1 isoform X1 [Fundulus heteroclitus]XP_021180152.2 anaphase-promoting complex subunit 1 isoform X1 [Fundulus heteroclitus]
MSEVVYEETATMIAAGDLHSFVPFGREHCRNHPNAFNLQLRELQPASELWSSDGAAGLVGSLQEVSLQERERESWQLRKGHTGVNEDEAEFEEELYAAGNVAVWSQGSRTQASSVYKAFTVDSPVQQALWCDFAVPQNNNEAEELEQTVCIVQSSCINVHTVTGKDFISPLPFQVSNVWATKFGLLLERKNAANDTQPNPPGELLPTVFSMLHPLDEIAPIVSKPSGLFEGTRVQYVSDPNMKIVFTCCQPSIVISYDTVQGTHTVWALRKVTQDERSTVLRCPTEPAGTPMSLMASGFLTSHLRNASHLDSPGGCGAMGLSSAAGISSALSSPLHYSALHSHQSRIMTSSPGVHPRVHSPSISNMAALSRAHSPGMAAPSFSGTSRFNTSFHTPSPRGHHGLLPSPNSTANESMLVLEMEPIIPDLCVEQLWSETVPTGCHREMSSQASKVFLTSDLCENHYLCFLVESHQHLRCVKFIQSNDSTQLIFPSVTTIPAKDAAPLQNIDAMLVLEACGSLVLYTGVTRVSKVYVPNLPSPSISLNNCLPHLSMAVETVSTPNSGSRQIHRLNEDAMPSPVSDLKSLNIKHHEASFFEDYTFQQPTPFIHTLRDPVCNRVTLELSSGVMLRISIPEIATSELVRRCLQAVRFILPKEVAMKVLVKWYNIYNAPGGPSAHAEWSQFVTCFMTLMGYNTERLAWTRHLQFEVPLSPVIAAKKARPSDRGSDEDWDYLLASHYHRQINSQPVCGSVDSCGASDVTTEKEDPPCTASPSSSSLKLESSAPLFPHIPALFYVLHLLYQELQLDELHRARAASLVCLLQQLARDLQMEEYVDLYWRDYPSLISCFTESCMIDQAVIGQMQRPSFLRSDPPCVFTWLSSCLRGEESPPFPFLPGICQRTKLLLLSYALYIIGDVNATSTNVSKYLFKLSAGQKSYASEPNFRRQSSVKVRFSSESLAEQLVVWLSSQGFTLKDLESVPFGVALPIREAICQCREQPSSDWPEEVCLLIGRQDLTKQAHKMTLAKTKASVGSGFSLVPPASTEADEEEDGMLDIIHEVTGLIWSQDLRVQEVRRLLQSSRPVRVSVVQLPEVSDHEYIEEKENKLLQLCQRTMALPVGRGLFTLFSYHPVPTEPLPVPKLNLTGRASPRNTVVDLNSGNIDVPPNMTNWPSFHNGVAAGLKIAPASQVDSAWIAYNKPKSPELANEYAGFLMALGLNGHLTKLATLNIHDYLTKGHEMTSIGLLLGVSSAKLGTMDMSITRLLSIHIPALLPPTSTELDVPHNVQVAAVIGIGLVYQGTGHRHNAEVLLSEIGRPPGPEMEYCTDRESYSLAAGLALGMVCLGHGSNLIGMTDLNVPEQLYQYMVGGHRRAQAGASRERHKSPSYQIKEGDTINVDVTCPGATLALAMIYLKTNNRSIADWLKPPDTWFLLDFIKPEFLLLRTLARCIIMWDEILPNTEWVKSNIPQIMRGNFDPSEDINMDTMAQAQDYITAGACMALGLRFAGSASSDAFDCLYEFARTFMKMMSFAGTAAVGAQMGYYNLQTCLSMILLAMSMVMAGTGNLKVLQLCRFFHKRTGGEMNYGFHMAHHMALGLLFLGGGRYSLSTSNSAIAALLCALYPHFPAHSTDNRYHLQALRHLAVLAAEPRLLVPVDVDSLKPCYALLEVTYKGTKWYNETTVELMAPTLLPELHLLKQVKVKGPRYWELCLDLSKETQHLKSILIRDGVLYVKLRAGQLPYKDDPQGWKSLLATTVNHRNPGVTAFKPAAISTFTSEPALISFAEFFCKTSEGLKSSEDSLVLFSAMLYECVTQECPEMLPTYIAIEQAVGTLRRGDLQQTFPLWQLRLVVELWDSRMLRGAANKQDSLLTSEFLPVMKNAVDVALDTWLKDHSSVLRSYMRGEDLSRNAQSVTLACFLVYRSIPYFRNTNTHLEGCSSFADLLLRSSQLGIPLRDLLRLVPLLSSASGSQSLLFPLQTFSS